ncbi:MAG TPA: Gfo/Idh/MocA family oxidoreductase [Chthonomonadaceae bacterium]|nr:Gfo/Idh/MocA family oxidoreductase [Chthonomonadaceae bacterium]
MTERVRVAVVGTGWWATATHIPALRDDPGVDLVALCDVNPERAQAAAKAYGVERTYTDHRALLAAEKPDAVVVATTHATHFDVAWDCLEAGAHVLIEKPMTLLAADARALTELAAERGCALIIGYPWNYMAHARQARDRIASGELGPLQLVQCVFNSYNTDLIGGRDRSEQPGSYPVHGPGDVYSKKEHSGGGHGHLQMTHAAGLLFFVSGLRISRVQARMANHGLPLDLVDVMIVEFAGGALGTVSGTSNAFLPQSRLHIGCTNGTVEMDVFAGTTFIKTAHGEREALPPAEEPDLRFAPVRNLVRAARGLESSQSPAEVGWHAVELLDAAYRSASTEGRPVAVEELYS